MRRRWTASTLRPSASSLDSEHPSLEVIKLEQRAVLLVYPAFGRVRCRWTASTLRPSALSLDSEHPSPECVVAGQRAPFARGYDAGTATTLRLIDRVYHAGTASTLRLSDHCTSIPPSSPFLFLFSAPAGVLLVYLAFRRVRCRWTTSTLRPSALSLGSEHPSAECVVAGQRAPFARVRRRNSENPCLK